jgi:hypothetical protein
MRSKTEIIMGYGVKITNNRFEEMTFYQLYTEIGGFDMGNIIDYAEAMEDSFTIRNINAVDSLILSQFAYLQFSGFVPGFSDNSEPISIGDLAKNGNLDKLFIDVRDSRKNRRLFHALSQSPRFRNVRLAYHVDKTDFALEKQFSAITYLLDNGMAYIAYRGTDSTFVGWKEDFNMAFLHPVPSQEEGAIYLNTVAGLITSDLIVGGHSKGGNIAVYSSLRCNPHIRGRITTIYSHDGPGFIPEVLLSEGYSDIQAKIRKTQPQSSVIGMLLQHQEPYRVVKSNRIWIMQHDPFSWLVEREDFLYVGTVRGSTKYTNEILNRWILSVDKEKRELFVDTLYQVVKATDAKSFHDLTDDWRKKAIAVVYSIKDIDGETRWFVLKTIGSLFVLLVKNLKASS